jgi:hypothetical protein
VCVYYCSTYYNAVRNVSQWVWVREKHEGDGHKTWDPRRQGVLLADLPPSMPQGRRRCR